MEEADIEDIFGPKLFIKIVNSALGLTGEAQLTVEKLASETSETRLLKKVEACCRLLPVGTLEFDHYISADWLVRNPTVLDADTQQVKDALDRAEKVIATVNKILPTA
jgi:hypothetical protein